MLHTSGRTSFESLQQIFPVSLQRFYMVLWLISRNNIGLILRTPWIGLLPFSICFLLWIVLKSSVCPDDGETSVIPVSSAESRFQAFCVQLRCWSPWCLSILYQIQREIREKSYVRGFNPFFIIILFNIEILFSKAYHFYRTEQNIKQVLNPVKFAQPLPFTLKPMLSTWIPYANTNRRLASLLTTGTLGFGLRSDFVTTFYCTSHFLRSDLICSTK